MKVYLIIENDFLLEDTRVIDVYKDKEKAYSKAEFLNKNATDCAYSVSERDLK